MLDSSKAISALFEYTGLFVVSFTLIRTAWRVFNNLGTFYFGFGSVNLKSYGSWAVVTGCTDGIGKAYAEKLAKLGVDLVLISRTLSKLEGQAKQLTQEYGSQTKVIAADFTGLCHWFIILLF
jgi:17beta-estradiol 17-dehydrogenase / very-long-chain 3-oxoacyl-CoA reductase